MKQSYKEAIYYSFLYISIFCAILAIRILPPLELSNNSEKSSEMRLLSELTADICDGIDINNLVSSVEKSNADLAQKVIKGTRKDNKLEILIDDKDYTKYGIGLAYYAGPFAAFAIFSIIGFVSYFYCCCCDCCVTCASRNFKEKPLKKPEMCSSFYTVTLFALLIVGGSVAGFAIDSQLKSGTRKIFCVTMTVMNDFLEGVPTYNFNGLTGTVNILYNIIDQILNITNNVDNNFGDQSWADTAIDHMKSDISDIYTNYKGKTLDSPTSSTDKVESEFITNLLGPITDKSTMTGIISYEMEIKSFFILGALNMVKNYSETLKNNSDQYNDTLNKAKNQISDLTKPIYDVSNSTKSFSNNGIDYSNTGQLALFGFWAIFVVLGVLVLLGGFMGYCCDVKCCGCLLHTTWIFMSILMIITFLLTAILIPFSIVTFEACDILDRSIHEKAYFENRTNALDKSIVGNITVCLFGDGDLIKQFNMADQLSEINNLTENVLVLFDSNKTDVNSTATTIDTFKELADNYTYGLVIDTKSSDISTANDSFLSLKKFNQYTDFSNAETLSCNEFNDEWVFNLTNCSDHTKTNWSNSNAPTDSSGPKICIPINSFDDTKADTRYATLCNSAPTVKTNAISYHHTLYNYDTSRRNLFGNISEDLTSLKNKNDKLIENITAFKNKVKNYVESAVDLARYVSDPNSGIFSGMNCTFLQLELNRMHEGLCTAFLINIYGIAICLAIVSFGLFFSSLFALKLALKLGKYDHNKTGPKDENNDEKAKLKDENVHI